MSSIQILTMKVLMVWHCLSWTFISVTWIKLHSPSEIMHIIKQQWTSNSGGNSNNYTVTQGDNSCVHMYWQMKLLRVNLCALSDVTSTTANRRCLIPLFCKIHVLSGKILSSLALWKCLSVGSENVVWTLLQIPVNKNCVSECYKYLILFRYKNIPPARIQILSLLSLISVGWVLRIQHISADLAQLVEEKSDCFTLLWWIPAELPAIRWDSARVILCMPEAAWLYVMLLPSCPSVNPGGFEGAALPAEAALWAAMLMWCHPLPFLLYSSHLFFPCRERRPLLAK